MRIPIAVALLLAALAGCRSSEPTPPEAEPAPATAEFPPRVPSNLAGPLPSPQRNPLTADGVALGRRLFYDPVLSKNDAVSCASCHIQRLAFTDGVALSRAGVSGKPLRRHSPTLANVAWAGRLFWDGGGSNLESQAFGPLQHVDEMALPPRQLKAKLTAHTNYPALFAKAFDDGVTVPNIVRALAQFQRTLISADSRYDRHVRGEPGGDLTPIETRGLAVFAAKCAGCHPPGLFTDNGYHDTGLDAVFSDAHERLAWGRARITHKTEDKGKYKTPTLRNVALTAPYLHDGRFGTLDEVLNHYREGVKRSPNLDGALQGESGELGIRLTDEEASALIAFLHTLTDERFVSDSSLGPLID